MILHIVEPYEKFHAMKKNSEGYFQCTIESLEELIRYYYLPDGGDDCADPSSAAQPEGIHGPSETVNHGSFHWNDQDWKGLACEDLILYELHVGTFTPEGTFEAIIPRLDELMDTGINAIELMPLSPFSGERNWGYDGVFPYAVQQSYGGPQGLKELVNACHQKGIAVFLDVVYNHIGPEGNIFENFGPYFTEKYCTPWGKAINFDGEWSDGVRDYFSDNAIYWFEHYHIDGLRLDAVHTIFDNGAVSFWELLSKKTEAFEKHSGRRVHLIAESDLNSPRVTKTIAEGGKGFRGQWLDDFHHALYVLLDEKGRDRYIDFGKMQQLAKAYTDGFVHSGEFVKFRKRKHGASSAAVTGDKFVAFNLNHDQAGNRPGGERLSMLVSFEKQKIAAAALMLAPYVPMLFMGEEYGDDTPFYYFVSHSDKLLITAVREGRKNEFREFGGEADFTDPQLESTYLSSKIQWEKRYSGHYQELLFWNRELIKLRKSAPLRNFQ
ncbi:MAG TPA: malto-oligosyltrehalose trehalohydrolase, partial [Parasegetibacter sp.]